MLELVRRLVSFLGELKRRKVYRVTVAYLIVAVGSLELLDVVLPSTTLPGWADELFLGLAILGFPLVVMLAWAFDVTPEGVRRAPGASGEVGTAGEELAGKEPDLDARAVAVLPFENLSGTAEAEPFAAGLHDDLLTELSRISALTVISRTSVMGYRGTTTTVSTIGRELGVGTIVEGAVQHAAGRVRLNVQLIDARDDVHRWAERYDRELTPEGIFELQTELAGKIAGSLRAELTPEELSRHREPPTASLAAYRLFSQGRALLDHRTESDVHRALECFQSAMEEDPGYGLAWAGVAESLALIEYYDYARPAGAPDAVAAARRAVELAPESGEAHTSLGIVRALRRDGPEAVDALRRALELSPSDAEASAWLGWLHLVLGRPEKGLEPSARATELNPLAPATHVFLADTLLAHGDAEGALEEARKARHLAEDYPLSRFVEGLALHHLGRFERARGVFERLLPLVRPRGTPSRPEVRALLALTHVATGDPGEARSILESLRGAGHPFSVGLILAALDERDAAFESFARIAEWRSFTTEHVRYFFPRELGPLRPDSRYAELLRNADRHWGLEG